jgi:hypothetical protein
MKKLLFLYTVLGIASSVSAQAYEDKIQYDKKKQPAIAIDYAYSEQAVENAIIARFDQMGYKVKEEKGIFNSDRGFLVFKNAYVTEISRDRFDYIIKVERKSRKDADAATLYLVILKDDQNAMDRMEAVSVGRAKAFLNNLIPDIEAADLELQIRDREDVLGKAEKRLKDLQDDKLALEKKMDDNAKAQDDTIKDLENQRKILEDLKNKRKRGD